MRSGLAALTVVLTLGVARAEQPALHAIEDPGGSLARFYQVLARVQARQSGALLRVLHYGDSFTSDDAITRRARERLQALYGDGGAGWVPFGAPSPSFRHHTVGRVWSGWTVKNVTFKRIKDARYGIGGSAFEGGSGAQTTLTTMSKGKLGTAVARFELQYLVQPGGGTLELTLDGKPHGVVETAGPEVKAGFHAFTVADGAHTLKVRVARGRVRVYGVVMERAGPGVTYDNLGLASNSARSLNAMSPEFLRQQHQHRDADLIVVHLGGNGVNWFAPTPKALARYQGIYAQFLRTLREAAPRSSCLVMASTDAGYWAGGVATSKPGLPKVVAAQRAAALDSGCAFWDVYTWMGGKGAVRKWLQQGAWTTGLNHPNSPGAERIGLGLVAALEASFADQRKKKN